MWAPLGSSLWASSSSQLIATVCVAKPLSATISTPAIANRNHMPRHNAGARSRSEGWSGALIRYEETPPADDAFACSVAALAARIARRAATLALGVDRP